MDAVGRFHSRVISLQIYLFFLKNTFFDVTILIFSIKLAVYRHLLPVARLRWALLALLTIS